MTVLKYRITYVFCWIAAVCLLSCCSDGGNAIRTIVTVAGVEQFRDAVMQARPGTVIEVEDGDYAFDDAPLRVSVRATESSPIIIRACNRGKARFTGEYSLLLDGCSYVTVDGFVLNNRALKHALPRVTGTETWIDAMRDELPYHGSLLVLNSSYCRLTRLNIELEEQEGFSPEMIRDRLPRMHWVNLSGGSHNRIDRCRFSGKINSGVYVEIGPQEQHFRIDHNHFDGRPPGNYNGFETIRTNPGNLNRMYGMIDYNLFENCDGEGEIISVKSSVLRISQNTFRDCKGMLCIRMGSHVTIDYNFFLNPSGKKGVGGIRIHGNDNNILNNYFSDLTATGLMTFWGDFDKPDFRDDDSEYFNYDFSAEANSYRQSCRAYISFNTWVNCASFLKLGEYRSNELADQSLPPKDWTFLNNLVVCRNTPFISGSGETGFRWIGNIFWSPDAVCTVGRTLSEARVTVADPKIERSADGIWRLTKGSPAVDSGRGWYYPAEIVPGFNLDIDGQSRDLEVKVTDPQVQSEFKFDVGADEFADTPITNRPLTSVDVGVDAL